MSKLSFSVKFLLVESRSKGTTAPIFCRITVNRKKAEFTTNHLVPINKWSSDSQRVKGDPEITAKLNSIFNDIIKLRDEILYDGEIPTAKLLKERFLRKDETELNLFEYFEECTDQIEFLRDCSKSTWKKYSTVKRHLHKFLKKENKLHVTFEKFDLAMINRLQDFMKIELELSVNTTTKYLKILKTIYNRAKQYGLTNAQPFNAFKFKHQEVNRAYLSDDEVLAIEGVELDNDSLERVRDAFLFSVYTGLRFSDVKSISPNAVVKDFNDEEWLEIDSIVKTGRQHRVPLLDKSLEIISKYSGEAEMTNKLIPMRSNQKVNTYLKVICDLAGIEKNVTFHTARHTFATTITLNKDVPIEIVSEMLGHKNIATTRIYAKITNQHMSRHARRLNEIFN